MKIYLLCLFTLIQFITNAQYQHVNRIHFGYNNELIILFPTAKYYEQDIYYNGLFKKTLRAKKQNSGYEEFIRYSDTSYLYLQYDSIHRIISKGILAKDPNDSVIVDIGYVPDFEKDPTGEKGIVKGVDLPTCYYLNKILNWTEQDSSGKIYKGLYSAGKRDGIWKEGHYQYPSWADEVFVIEKILRYNNGEQDVQYLPDYSLKAIWSKLEGEWWFDISCVDEQYMLTKKQVSHSSRHKLNFIDSVHLEKTTPSGTEKLKWELKNNILTIYGPKIERLRITYISPDLQLYLAPINN